MFISSKRQFSTIMFKFSEMVSFVYSFRAGLASRTDEIKGAYTKEPITRRYNSHTKLMSRGLYKPHYF